MRTISNDAAARIALGAQGFSRTRPSGNIDVRHFRRVMRQVGLVQLDSVNVCVRTHYMPFYSRLGAYDMGRLDSWLNTSGE
ncbi:MAG: winged helix-turn-helix domain-containing protein, partial [Actinomycetia bacterium]|nr:winged helix-turn-helix domain-containing protein [Actinomycetes bacterium]